MSIEKTLHRVNKKSAGRVGSVTAPESVYDKTRVKFYASWPSYGILGYQALVSPQVESKSRVDSYVLRVAEQLHISDSDSDSDSDFISVLPRRFENVVIFLRFVSTLPSIFARSEVSKRNQSIRLHRGTRLHCETSDLRISREILGKVETNLKNYENILKSPGQN